MWQLRFAAAITSFDLFNGVVSMCRDLVMKNRCSTGAELLAHTWAILPNTQLICLITRNVYAVKDVRYLLHLDKPPGQGLNLALAVPNKVSVPVILSLQMRFLFFSLLHIIYIRNEYASPVVSGGCVDTRNRRTVVQGE
jgi:hypothetical protein